MISLFHRLFGRIGSQRAPAQPHAADVVGDHLRAVIAAGAQAKTDNSRSYEARVRSMMDDFFLRMRETDARPRS